MARPDQRSPEALAYRRLYSTARWRRIRAAQINVKQPLCEACLKAGRHTRATVCDHIDPTTKVTAFFDGPFQSLCDAEPWRCHSRRKQIIETRGYEPGCDAAGRPIDPTHPWSRGAAPRRPPGGAV
jgi:5-methylcytosine-specific restriction protein A